MKDQRPVELVDLRALIWLKRRWSCPATGCAVGSFIETAGRIATERFVMPDRAGRWVTEQADTYKLFRNEVTVEIGL